MAAGNASARWKPRAVLLLCLMILGGICWWAFRAVDSQTSPAATDRRSPSIPGLTAEPTPAKAADAAPRENAKAAPGEVPTDSRETPQRPDAFRAEASATTPADDAASAGGRARAGATSDDDEPQLFPNGWRRCFGTFGDRSAYEFAADSSTASTGSWSVRITSRTARPDPPGAGICQHLAATAYRGKRVRVTLHMRSRAAEPGAHMLFRADAATGEVVAFYNMSPGWVRGTNDWAEHSAVLDVPANASVIIIAGMLVNSGTLWIDDAALEVVDAQSKVTQPAPPPGHYNQVIATEQLPTALQNPGFEENSPVPPGA